MTQTFKKISNVATTNERRIFYVLLSLIAAVAFFYGFFVQQTIVNVVEREKGLKEVRVVNSRIGDLESAYIAIKNNITIDLAYERGFKDAVTTEYISKNELGKVTLRSNAN